MSKRSKANNINTSCLRLAPKAHQMCMTLFILLTTQDVKIINFNNEVKAFYFPPVWARNINQLWKPLLLGVGSHCGNFLFLIHSTVEAA